MFTPNPNPLPSQQHIQNQQCKWSKKITKTTTIKTNQANFMLHAVNSKHAQATTCTNG